MSIDSYSITTLLGLGRLLLGAGVLYGLAWCLFPLRAAAWTGAPPSERRWVRLLLAVALVTVLTQSLVALHLYDGLMLAGCLALTALVITWWRLRDGGGTTLYVRLLTLIERTRSFRSLLSPLRRRISARSLLVGTLLGGLVVGSAILRTLPILSSPAPFSVAYYRLLEIAKHLQANQLFPGALLEERGLHSLTVALHALTDIDLGLVVRLLGILSSLYILVGIYAATRGSTGDTGAALGAAGLFGLGLPLLPFAIENQVEATPVLLAAAYALPTWYLFLRYQAGGIRSHLWGGTAGLILVLLTNGSVAVLMLGVLAGLGLLQSAFDHTWRGVLVTALSVGSGLLLGGLVVLRRSLADPDPYAVPLFSVGGAGLSLYPTDWSLPIYGGLVGTTALALLVSALTDRSFFRRLTSWALAVTCPSLYTAWLFLAPLPYVDLAPMAPPALLSIFLAVGLGTVFARTADGLRRLLRLVDPAPFLRPLYFGSVSGLLLVGLVASPPPLAPTLDPGTEPAGYVRALQTIQHEGAPYQWTVVSHYGTAVHAMNRGRFLSYDYFLHHYDARTYDPAADIAIPTADVFLFVPTDSTAHLVRDELLLSNRETTGPMQRWANDYQRRTGELLTFYADEHLTVYRLRRPSQRSQQKASPFPRLLQNPSTVEAPFISRPSPVRP